MTADTVAFGANNGASFAFPFGEDVLRKIRENEIKKVEFFYVAMKDEALLALADALRQNFSVTSLVLRNVDIDDDGAKTLAHALSCNNAITRLDLDGNRIGDAGLKALAHCVIRNNDTLLHLSLDNNRYGVEGVAALADAIAGNSSLEALRIGGPTVDDAGVKLLSSALSKNSSVKEIFMNAYLGHEGAMALAILLKQTSSIETLIIQPACRSSMPLQKIGNEAAKAFACAIVLNTSLTRLVIHQPTIEEDGWNWLLTAKALLDSSEKVSDELVTSFFAPFMDGSSPMKINLADVGRCMNRATGLHLLPKLSLIVTPRNIDAKIWQLCSRAGQRRVLNVVSTAVRENLRNRVYNSNEGVYPLMLEWVGSAVGATGVYEMVQMKPELFQNQACVAGSR